MKARRNEDEEVLAKATSKSAVLNENQTQLEENVEKLLAVAKAGQVDGSNDKKDRSRTPNNTPTNSRG